MAKVTINGNDYFSEDDGVTHINIYSGGKTPLGRFLSNFTYATTETPHGRFNSLEGYYHYLKSTMAIIGSPNSNELFHQYNDTLYQLRQASGKSAQHFGRALRQQLMANGVWFDDTQSIIKNGLFVEALKSKISSSGYRERFLASTLPFTHYYLFGNTINFKPHYNDLSDVLTELRSQGV